MKFSEFTTGLIEKLDSASQNPINHCLLKSADSSFISRRLNIFFVLLPTKRNYTRYKTVKTG
jgi:hypothetical protein